MPSQTTKVKNGSIALPPEIRKSWRGAEVFVQASDDTIVVKKIQRANFWDTWEKMKRALREVGKGVTQKDIDEAIAWARRKQKAR